MFIPDEKVEEVRAASDIVEVVSDYVRLKKRGSNFIGLCPFHNEKTPSFNVNPGMGIYKCFGCGVGGDVYQFVTAVEKVSFPEAVRMLAERAGIPLPEQEAQSELANEYESIYHALRFAGRFFFHQLTQTEGGKPALDYLKRRGFTAQTIKTFGIGYAQDAWDMLLREAEANHIDPDVLEKAGLIIPRRDGSGYYDRYRGRVIFPIISRVGKVLGFGGRILKPDSDQPKYINSPETTVYSKSRVLYGLYQGKQDVRRKEEVILVEGYTDVISLHQAGVKNVVASSGTALTVEQVKTIGRYAKRVLLLYDADAAGANAAIRGIDLVIGQGLTAYAVSLPGGEDPDSYVQANGAEAFEDYLKNQRQDFVAFMYALARRDGRLDTPEGQAETQRSVVRTVGLIPDPLTRESYLRRASEVLDIPDMQLREVLGTMKTRQQRTESRSVPMPTQPPPGPEPIPMPQDEYGSTVPDFVIPAPDPHPGEKTLILLMLEHGNPMIELILGNMGVDEFTEGAPQELVKQVLEMYNAGKLQKQRFLDGSCGVAVQQLATEVLMPPLEPSENWSHRQNITVPRLNQNPEGAALSAMTLVKAHRVKGAIERQRKAIYQATQHGGEVRTLQQQMMALIELKKQIESGSYFRPSES